MAIFNRGCGKLMRNFDRFILELLNFLELFLFETKQTKLLHLIKTSVSVSALITIYFKGSE